jgi:hypothetical protein
VFLPLLLALTAPQVEASRSAAEIVVDGRLDEPIWRQAKKISAFRQRELVEGAAPSERTEVAIAYDDERLYLAIWAFDREPQAITAFELARDFGGSDDRFSVILDTYQDGRNGYLFSVNPNGAMADSLVTDGRANADWDGVWWAEVQRDETGWQAELVIPFSTLRFYDRQDPSWGVNFERRIARKMETVRWTGWQRNTDLTHLDRAGILTGLRGIRQGQRANLKPYALGGWQRTGALEEATWNAGGDIDVPINPAVKLSLTLNPDFAQAEADRTQLNLTRYDLFLPEKRRFFLEGRHFFNFKLGDSVRPFYSRRIGLDSNNETVPIFGGVRILAKHKRNSVGFLSTQMGPADTTQNATVLRWQRDLGERSSFGLMGAGLADAAHHNVVIGGDGTYATHRLFGTQRLRLGGAAVASHTSGAAEPLGSAQRLFVTYPNDGLETGFTWTRIDRDFDPQLGFLPRRQVQTLTGYLEKSWRPKGPTGFRWWAVRPMEFTLNIDDDGLEWTDYSYQFSPFQAVTHAGDWYKIAFFARGDRVEEPWEIVEGFGAEAGEHSNLSGSIMTGTSGRRAWRFFAYAGYGSYYGGERLHSMFQGSWSINRNVKLALHQGLYWLRKGEVSKPVVDASFQLHLAARRNLFGSIMVQGNTEVDALLINARLRYIPSPGADCYLVVNQTLDRSDDWRATDRAVLAKLVWWYGI